MRQRLEQYEILPARYWKNIRTLLEKFKPIYLYIRRIGSKGGGVVVNEDLKGKKLEIRRGKKCLVVSIDGCEKFRYEQGKTFQGDFDWGKDFSLAYDRGSAQGFGRYASCGFRNPDDPNFPPILNSILRGANFTHLMEITFAGKVPLKKTEKEIAPGFPYWEIKC